MIGDHGFEAAAEFADRGFEVVCAMSEFEELDEDEARKRRFGRLRMTKSTADAARHGEIIIMAFGPRDECAGLERAAMEIARNLSGPTMIVTRTQHCGATAERVVRLLARHSAHELLVISERYIATGSSTSPRSSMRLRWAL